jgi:hypothetical protein
MTHISIHIRDITRALYQMAAHTPPVTLYGTPNIHMVYIHRTINSTTTQAGRGDYSQRGIREYKAVN